MSAALAYIVPFDGGKPEAVNPASVNMSDDSERLTKLHDSLIDKGVFDARIGGFSESGVVVFGNEHLLAISNAVVGSGFSANTNAAPSFARDFGRAAGTSAFRLHAKPSIMGGFGGYVPMAA